MQIDLPIGSGAGGSVAGQGTPATGEGKLRQQVHIRWMVRRDLGEVLGIERRSFPAPWSEKNFIHELRQRATIGLVATGEYERVLGFVIYDLAHTHLYVRNFAVHPSYRRRGIGEQIIAKLKSKLAPQRRRKILLDVWDGNLDCHLFLKSQGFKAIRVLPDFFDTPPGDAYRFVYDFHFAGAEGPRVLIAE